MSVPARVRYRERQRLRAVDLRAEQEYLLGLAGRHNVGPHEWGIVRGLALKFSGNILTVQPGLAVDGYGREIVVLEPIQVELDAEPVGKLVYLFACQRPHGSCGDSANSRWRDSTEVIISFESLPLPDTDPELALVRAAGLSCDVQPWPILLGDIAQGSPEFVADLSNVRSTRVKAAQVVAPSGGSVVRVGKGTRGDQYHFRISSRVGTTVLDRLAVDQDSNVYFWGDLIVTGSALAPIVLNMAGELLTITALPSAGGQIRWRSYIEEETENNLVLEFRDLFGQRDLLVLPVNSETIPEVIEEFNKTSKLVSVKLESRNTDDDDNDAPLPFMLANIAIPILQPQIPSNGAALSPIKTIDSHDTDFRYQSPRIVFKPETPNAPASLCGCTDDGEKLFVLPNGIGFNAGLAPPKVPARDVYSIKVGEGEQQHEQLRASLGTFEPGDFGTRFSIGSMKDDGNNLEFNQWLKVRGSGAVELPGGQIGGDGSPFLMLKVNGTLKLPPLKPDPRDRLFKDLLLLSFLAGVLSHSGARVNVVTVLPLPDLVETGQDFVFSIRVTNQDVQPLTEIKGTDRFIGFATMNPLNLPTTPINPGLSQIYQITHPPAHFTNLNELSVELTIEGQVGNRKVAGRVVTTPPIPVIKSPAIDLTMIPAQVPAGWSTPILVENRADRDLTIVGDLVAKGLGTDQQLQPSSGVLHALEITDTSALKIPPDLTGSHDLEVELTYHWPAPPTNRTIRTIQIVTVQKFITASIVATPVADAAWTFDLTLRNTSGRAVRLQHLQVIVTTPNDPPKVVDFSFNDPGRLIRTNQTFTQSDLEGIIGPSGTIETVAIQMKFRRQNQTWDPVVDTLEPIEIP